MTLKDRREAAGFKTQEALAERTGLRQGYISNLENGRVPNPTMATVRTLSDALGCSLEAFMDSVAASVAAAEAA